MVVLVEGDLQSPWHTTGDINMDMADVPIALVVEVMKEPIED
jgi:hypothetical protein